MKLFQQLTSLPVIDAHVHVFPPELFQAIKRWFEKNAWPFHTDGLAEDFIQAQFEAGAAGLTLLPYAHAPGLADMLNEFIAGLVGRFPNTRGLAAIHPHDPHPEKILDRAFDELGLIGVKLHPHVLKIAPDDSSMQPVYEAVTAHGRVMVIHGGREPAAAAYGFDVRSITGAERVEKALKRFPDLKLVIPHLGIDEEKRFYDLLTDFPGLYLDTAMVIGDFFGITPDRDRLERHSDRIMYGTDYPHIPYPVETELRALLSLGLSRGALRRILSENAAVFYGFSLERAAA